MRLVWLGVMLLVMSLPGMTMVRQVTETPYAGSPWSQGTAPALQSEPYSLLRETVGERTRLVINGTPQQAYDEIIRGSFGFGPYNRHWVYLARNGHQQFIVFDRREDPSFDAVKILHPSHRWNNPKGQLTTVDAKDFIGQDEDGMRDPRMYQWMFAFSPDGDHGAYVVQDGDSERVVADGQAGARYARIGMLCYSLTGGHLAYTAMVDDQWRVITDGKEGPLFTKILDDELTFSADGTHIAYPVLEEKLIRMVLDDQPQTITTAWIDQGSLTFSPDGRHLAYIALHPSKKTALVLDDHFGKPYDGMEGILFSPDSRHVASTVRFGDQLGIPAGPGAVKPKDIEELQFQDVLSGSGMGVAIGAQTRWAMVIDGMEGKQYPYVTLIGAAFSPDNRHFAYSAFRDDRKWAAVIDGTERGTYDFAGNYAFSPDSAGVGYGIRVGKQVAIVVDGKRGPLLDELGRYSFRFSPDSKRFLYVAATKGAQWVVADHQQSPLHYGYLIGSAEFTPDSRHVVYAARRFDRTNPQRMTVHDFVTVDDCERAFPYVIDIYDGTTPNGRAIFFDATDRFHYFFRKGDGKTFVGVETVK